MPTPNALPPWREAVDAEIPHVPWDEIHGRVGGFWIPGDAPHHAIVSQTRGGKSYLIGNGILKHKERERVLIIDVKGDDPTYAEIGRPIDKIPSRFNRSFNDWLSEEKPREHWYRLVVREDWADARKQVGKALADCYREHDWTVVLDETRALTDPRLFSGIGNAYSDEILFDARLSPVALTQKLTSEQIERLFKSTRNTLTKWIELLRAESSKVQGPTSDVQNEMSVGKKGGQAPAPAEAVGITEKVTAFRPEMAVHGKYQQPCLRCGARVQRIRYASNETNYCPNCQTGGKLLADRALSRLLRADWSRSLEELEGIRSGE